MPVPKAKTKPKSLSEGSAMSAKGNAERPHALLRGVCLFLGVFSLLNVLSHFLHPTSVTMNLWWIDSTFLGIPLGGRFIPLGRYLELIAALLLILWAIKPRASLPRRVLTEISVAALALIALCNAITYWQLLSQGGLYEASPVPLSLIICIALVAIAQRIHAIKAFPEQKNLLRITCFALVVALIFPLLQIGFFGTTDYRKQADAVIVLGAEAHDDGTPSVALAERMDTAVELYKDGYAPYLIVSGGIGANGVDESQVMSAYAQSKGVPASAILRDSKGDSTEKTMQNTLRIAEQKGFDTLLVTSSFYHLPRIKMLFWQEGCNVATGPTIGDITNNGTSVALWREIPAWWVYWLKGAF